MKIVDFLSIVLGASLTSVHSKPAYDYGTLLLTDDIIRVKKRHEDSTRGYLEQCGPVGFPMAQRGVVNVLAFLDSSWPYSHRQAIMLKMLNDRLRRSGLPDALFFVVNVDPSFLSAVDDAEDDIEKEAWLGVSPDEIESFSDIDRTVDSLELSMTPDIRLIQDNENLGIWKNLRGSRDQVLVIDRCGKLTYQVIVPWSILHFPYVKAAILSTYKDEPCGPCDIVRNSTEDLYSKNKTTTITSAARNYFQNDRESMIVSDTSVTTESYLRTKENISTVDGGPESFVSSTSEYRFENSQDTKEESSIASFLEFRITTESSTVPNLISKEDNCAMEFDSKKFDESTTLPVTVDITTESTYLHDTEDAISTSFVTYDTTDLIETVTSGLAAKNTVTISRLPEEEEISMAEHYLHNAEDAISTSFFTYDTTDSINTVTSGLTKEDTSSSDAAKITRLPKKEGISKNKHYLHDTEDTISTSFFTYDTTDSINTVTSDLTKEDTSNSDPVKITRLPKKEEIEMNQHYVHDSEDGISTSFFPSGTTDSLDTVTSGVTTEDALSSDDVTRLPEESEVSTNDNCLDRTKENFATTTSNPSVTDVTSSSADNYSSTVDTIDGKIETSTEETVIPTVDKILSALNRSISETRFEKYDAVISSSESFGTNFPIEYSTTTTEETFNSGATKNVRIEENSGINEDSHLPQDDSKKNEDIEEIGGLFDIPIRIIMHAPHFHVDGESTRMHEYLVLKTGSSEHHSHLGSQDATRLYSGPQDFHEKSDVIPSEEIEAKTWSMTNVIYNKNESPGLYGEVADFWRDTGSQEIYEDGDDAARPEDHQRTEEVGAEVELWKKPSKANINTSPETAINATDKSTLSVNGSSAVVENTEIPRADVTEKNPTNIEELNAEEEETRNRLIAHYSKLLPWIYYVLDK